MNFVSEQNTASCVEDKCSSECMFTGTLLYLFISDFSDFSHSDFSGLYW